MKEATVDQKRNLSEEDRKAFVSEKTMRELVHSEPMERLLLMLAKLGKTWDVRVYNDVADANHIEAVSINQFQFPELRSDVIEAQVKYGTHHLSSREIIHAMHMCSRNMHSPIYHLSANVKYLLKRTKGLKKVKLPYQEQINEAGTAMDDLNNLQLTMLNSFGWAKDVLGLDQEDIRVLSALFGKRHGAMTLYDIAQGTLLEGKMAYLGKNVEKLEAAGLVTSDKDIATPISVGKKKITNKKYFYMITQKGIGKIMEYLNHVHETTFGNKG